MYAVLDKMDLDFSNCIQKDVYWILLCARYYTIDQMINKTDTTHLVQKAKKKYQRWQGREKKKKTARKNKVKKRMFIAS